MEPEIIEGWRVILQSADPAGFCAVALSPDNSVEVAIDLCDDIEFAGPVQAEGDSFANLVAPLAVISRLLELRAAAIKEAAGGK